MRVECPGCRQTFDVPAGSAGQQFKCNSCGEQFTAPALPPARRPDPPSWLMTVPLILATLSAGQFCLCGGLAAFGYVGHFGDDTVAILESIGWVWPSFLLMVSSVPFFLCLHAIFRFDRR